MIIGVKRPSSFEDLHDHFKRYRLEEVLEDSPGVPGCPSWASTEEVIAAAVASSLESSDKLARESSTEHLPEEPAQKRLRVNESSPRNGSAENSEREASTRSWAEDIIKALHGCPSVDEACQRCMRILTDMEAEVRQATLREAECESPSRSGNGCSDERPQQDGSFQSLQHTNRVLMRAVHHLADRCRRHEVGNEEMTMLRQELSKSKESERRLQHSNELLQHHLRLHLGDCSDRPMTWGNGIR
jgi:hypothetical protein